MIPQTKKTSLPQSNVKVSWKIIPLIMIVALLVAVMYLLPENKQPAKTVYIVAETNYSDSLLPRHECLIIKATGQDIDSIDLQKLTNLNGSKVSFYDDRDKLPVCDGAEFFFAEHNLSEYCNNCSLKGKLCTAYFMTFYPNDINQSVYSSLKEYYINGITQEQYFGTFEVMNKMDNCGEE